MTPRWPKDVKVWVTTYLTPFNSVRSPTLKETQSDQDGVDEKLKELFDARSELPSRMKRKVRSIWKIKGAYGRLNESMEKQVLGIHKYWRNKNKSKGGD